MWSSLLQIRAPAQTVSKADWPARGEAVSGAFPSDTGLNIGHESDSPYIVFTVRRPPTGGAIALTGRSFRASLELDFLLVLLLFFTRSGRIRSPIA